MQVLVRVSGVQCASKSLCVCRLALQFMSRAEVSGQVEGLFSAVVHMEMRNHEDNTVSFRSLCTAMVKKGMRGN